MKNMLVSPVAKKEIFTKILQMESDMITDPVKEELREKYALPTQDAQLTGHAHAGIVGSAVRIVRHLMLNGACEAEMFRAIKYLAVCIDARKYFLDWKKAYEELMIGYLIEKYGGRRKRKLPED